MTLLGRRLLHPLRRSAGMSSSSALAAEAAPPSALRWAVLPWSFFIGENVLLSHNRASIGLACAQAIAARAYLPALNYQRRPPPPPPQGTLDNIPSFSYH